MNGISHFDLHPDAELLNAFAEHELSTPERDEVFAHLAGCARCREVVFLVHEAAAPVAEFAESAERVGELAFAAPMAAAAAPASGVAESAAEADPATGAAEPTRRSWFMHWRFAWIGAAAFAMTAVLTVTLIKRQRPAPPQQIATQTQEQLRATPPVETVNGLTATPLPAAPEAQSAQKSAPKSLALDSRSVAPPPTPVAPTAAASQSLPINGRQISALSQLSVQAPARASSTAARDSNGLAHFTSEGKVAQQAQAAPPAASLPNNVAHGPDVSQQQQQMQMHGQARGNFIASQSQPASGQSVASGAAAGAGVGGGVAPAVSSDAPQPAPQSASQTVTVSAEADAISVEPAHGGPLQLEANKSALKTPSTKKSGLTMLPSGLPLVSTAEAGPTQVAIDAIGGVFLSRDFGKTWNPVKLQWKGRAAKVRLAQPAGGNGGFAKVFGSLHGTSSGDHASGTQSEKQPADKDSDRAPAAQALFELVNDSNAVWTSSDGKTWKLKEPSR